MNRRGLLAALAVAAVVGGVFALVPTLDLTLAALFYDPARRGFPLAGSALAAGLRDSAMTIVTVSAVPAVLAIVMKAVRPHAAMIVPGRAALLLLFTLALGPGVLVNLGLKDHWGRPRPVQVAQFGGPQSFVPWWQPGGGCARNCSFVAGEASGAFWSMAWAALAPPGLRGVAYAGAIAFGLGVGVLRMAFGAHFFSDVVFSGVLVFLVIWLTHGALYRWRWAPSEQRIALALTRPAVALRRFGAKLRERGVRS